MPNLGAGVDQHVNTAPVPTWVYQPPAFVSGSNYTPTVRLYNEGNQVVYVGGANVSPFNGLPLAPGSEPLKMQNVQFGTIYTCSNVTVSATTPSATTSTFYAAGTTAFTMKAAVATGLAAGATFIVANTAGTTPYQEVLVVASTSASSVITTTTASLYDHASLATFIIATTTPGQLRVTAGT